MSFSTTEIAVAFTPSILLILSLRICLNSSLSLAEMSATMSNSPVTSKSASRLSSLLSARSTASKPEVSAKICTSAVNRANLVSLRPHLTHDIGYYARLSNFFLLEVMCVTSPSGVRGAECLAGGGRLQNLSSLCKGVLTWCIMRPARGHVMITEYEQGRDPGRRREEACAEVQDPRAAAAAVGVQEGASRDNVQARKTD